MRSLSEPAHCPVTAEVAGSSPVNSDSIQAPSLGESYRETTSKYAKKLYSGRKKAY